MTEVPLGSAAQELALARETLEAARALLNEHFVRPGRLTADQARTLRQVAGDRADADYDASATFDQSDSASDIGRAEEFVKAVETVLGS